MVNKTNQKFEEALKGLEKIVEKLERGDLPLEDAMEAFTEGIRLAQHCHKKLEEAENTVQMLLKNQEGSWVAAAFEPSPASEAKEPEE